MWWGAPKDAAQGKEDAAAPAGEPLDLPVRMEDKPRTNESILIEGLRALYEKGALCDLVFVAGGESFPAHAAIVAAKSSNFAKFLVGLSSGPPEASEDPMEGLLSVAPSDGAGGAPAADAAEPPAGSQSPPPPPAPAGDATPADAAAQGQRWPRRVELQVGAVGSPEAMRLMLSYIYTGKDSTEWEYQPSNSEVNKDVLRLARHFGLSRLHEHAARWLTKGLSTANVVDRLVTCEEFGLNRLRERIIEQLTAHPAELAVVSSSAEIMRHPRILQELLVQVASLCGVDKGDKADKAEKVDKAEKADKGPKKADKAAQQPPPERPEKPSAEKPPAKRAKRGAGA